MSLTVGNLQVNKFEKVSSLFHHRRWGWGQEGFPAQWCRGWGQEPWGSLYSDVQYTIGNGHIEPPPLSVDRQIDRHDWKHYLPTTSLPGLIIQDFYRKMEPAWNDSNLGWRDKFFKKSALYFDDRSARRLSRQTNFYCQSDNVFRCGRKFRTLSRLSDKKYTTSQFFMWMWMTNWEVVTDKNCWKYSAF